MLSLLSISTPAFAPAAWGALVVSFFFFSSRRRHTRWPRDWSSDVCSSDLPGAARSLRRARGRPYLSGLARRVGKQDNSAGIFLLPPARRGGTLHLRRQRSVPWLATVPFPARSKIGRASCRERVSVLEAA